MVLQGVQRAEGSRLHRPGHPRQAREKGEPCFSETTPILAHRICNQGLGYPARKGLLVTDYTATEYLTRWRAVKDGSAELEGPSLAELVASIEAEEPGFTEALLEQLGPHGAQMLAFDWSFWGRPKQLATLRVKGWRIMLKIAGRGYGKTRDASEWCADRIVSQGARDVALVGPSIDDVRQFMLGGFKRRADGANGSGLLDVLPPWVRYRVLKDECMVELPDLGCVVRGHSGEVPEYRGPAPDTVWCDEIIKWRYPERLLSNIRLACREVGRVPAQILITTSPKKLKLLRDLVMEDGVVVIHGTTHENRGNVDELYYQTETRRLAGTAQGAEELEGELGIEDGDELFKLGPIDDGRVDDAPPLDRVVVAVDPAGTKHRTSDETGIVAAGRAGDINDGHGFVLANKTRKYAWDEWGEVAVKLAIDLGASAIVLERNKFADAVAANIRTCAARLGWVSEARPGFKTLIDLVDRRTGRRIQIIEVLAMGDKATRARPVVTLYESKRMHHVGRMATLEDTMTTWDPASSVSPGDLDALVHAVTELFALDRPPAPSLPAGEGERMREANATLAKQAPSSGGQGLAWGGDRRGGGRRVL